ncbi:unnamed protein product [Acanthocheilonema viteae]|uniref:Uncharacterized protein n=1 Tax=Acanthocheilonema viteae TaxID=6277 RepID=A0A498SFH7_ACAVI|nr:unnamed protein product [Acanthocheilonema viteae]
MSEKKQPEKEDDLTQSSQVVTALDMFTASDYLMDNSMDNIEGMFKLLMNNPHNLTTFKYPNDTTQRISVEQITPMTQKFQRKTASITRNFSADSMMRKNQQFMRHSMQGLKSPRNIEPQTTLSSTAAPYISIVGPVRVQTVQKIDKRSMDKLFIDEILELYGLGVKYPSKELISIKPRILKSLPTATKNIPITVQSVHVGHDYVRIDRKIAIDRSKIKFQPNLNTKEMVEFGGGLVQENKEVKPNRKSKSEASILRTPVFNLIGPLVITAFQNTLHDASGNYKIYEEIELRADGSTAKPEITVIPFLRKESVLPKNDKQEIPIRYHEDILVGYNVMLIKRLIEIKPSITRQLQDFSLSEERNYVTDKTICTASSVTKSVAPRIAQERKMLVLQEPPIRTDLTVSSGSSGEPTFLHTAESAPIESFYERDQSSKTERTLRTALSSSEMINAVSKSHTEAFMSAESRASRRLHGISKLENPKANDYVLQAHSDSLRTGQSVSMKYMKVPEESAKSLAETTLSAKLLTARSLEDERKRSKKPVLFLKEKLLPNETMNSNSKIQCIYRSPSNFTVKTARSPTQSRSIYSSPLHPSISPRSPRQDEKHKFIPDDFAAVLPKGLSSFGSTCRHESDSMMDKRKYVRYDEPSLLSGSADKNDNKKSLGIPTPRSISNQRVITVNSCFPETNERALTAHELSRETLELGRSLREDKKHRFIEIPKKFLDTHSVEIPSRKMLSRLPQPHSSYFMSEQEPKNLKSRSTDVLLESEKKNNLSIVSEKDHALSCKRKFVLLPPTSSIISCSPKQLSTARSKESIIPQSSTMSKKAVSEVDEKVSVASKKTSKVIRSDPRSERFLLQVQSMKSGHKILPSTFTKQTQSKRTPSLISVTQESDDTKSSTVRKPSKWYEKSMFIDQSKSLPQMQATHIVTPISSDMSRSFDSTIMQKKSNVVKNASSIFNTLDENVSEASQAKGTSIMIQSKDEENLTIQLNITIKINNEEGKSNGKYNLKPERILVKGREVYRKKDDCTL